MSRAFLTRIQAYTKLGKSYSGTNGNYFITKEEVVAAGADPSKLTAYHNKQWAADDDIIKKTAADTMRLNWIGISGFSPSLVSMMDVEYFGYNVGSVMFALNSMVDVDDDIRSGEIVNIIFTYAASASIYNMEGNVSLSFAHEVLSAEPVELERSVIGNVLFSNNIVDIDVSHLEGYTHGEVDICFPDGQCIRVHNEIIGSW